jgi:hypothetical protein
MIVTSENDTSIASSYQSAISTTREAKCKILACSRNNKINVVYGNTLLLLYSKEEVPQVKRQSYEVKAITWSAKQMEQ